MYVLMQRKKERVGGKTKKVTNTMWSNTNHKASSVEVNRLKR